MAGIQVVGGVTGFLAEVDSSKALATRNWPVPGDQYRAAFKTTSLAFTNGANILTFRNPSSAIIAVTRLRARTKPMAIFTAAAAGLEVSLSWFVGRNWTTLGTTNRTALSFAGNNNKMRTSFGSASAEMGYASAAGGITGDTITQDANPFAIDSGSPQSHSITAAASPGAGVQDSFDCEANFMPSQSDGEIPLILAQNEGVRLVFNLTGTAAAIIVVGEVMWGELAAYPLGD
jgi:hypothetical protein